ncbi:MAG: protein tyrosine phosphatase [Deltaproteobacteria bacterium]|jgi:predicted protein tyrosine phosphatase|nr:protein tyrosine phosphatase [Deltaproteobacteria bacterium]
MKQAQKIKMLFVCSANVDRSRTAEEIFEKHPGLEVRSAGTMAFARRRLTSELASWAEVIVVMTSRHEEQIREDFPEEAAGAQFFCLDVPDEHKYMSPALTACLRQKMKPVLAALKLESDV